MLRARPLTRGWQSIATPATLGLFLATLEHSASISAKRDCAGAMNPIEEVVKEFRAFRERVQVVARERENGGFSLSARNPEAGPPRRIVSFRGSKFAAVIPGDTAAEAVLTQGISSFLSLYNAALVVRLILTWFPNPPAAVVEPLATVTDPYLGLFRGIIPPIGGAIDLSPILAFVVLDLFTNSAAALPCEGPEGMRKQGWGAQLRARFEAARARRQGKEGAAATENKSA